MEMEYDAELMPYSIIAPDNGDPILEVNGGCLIDLPRLLNFIFNAHPALYREAILRSNDFYKLETSNVRT